MILIVKLSLVRGADNCVRLCCQIWQCRSIWSLGALAKDHISVVTVMKKKTHQKLKSFMGPIRVIRTRISQPILHFSQSLCIQIATGCLDSVTRCSQRSVQYSYYKNLCLLNWVNIILLLECTFVRNKSFPSYVT